LLNLWGWTGGEEGWGKKRQEVEWLVGSQSEGAAMRSPQATAGIALRVIERDATVDFQS